MIFFKAKENEIGNVQHVTSQLVVYSSVDGFYVTQRKKCIYMTSAHNNSPINQFRGKLN